MTNFGEKIENTQKQEAHENAVVNHEAPIKAEEVAEKISKQEQQEFESFKKEEIADFAQFESDGEIDSDNKQKLNEINIEANVAKAELDSVIAVKSEVEKNPTQEQSEAFNAGKEMVLKLKAEGNAESSEYWDLYSHLTEGLGADMEWRNPADINAEKVAEMMTVKFPEKDQIVVRSCPQCGREYSGTNAAYCTACGTELKLKESDPQSEMNERVLKKAELLNEKEASKKLLAQERLKLAQEIREQRSAQGSRLSKMKNLLEIGEEKMEGKQGDKQFGRLSDLQSSEANLMAERISSEELNEQDVDKEKENMNQLIENSEKLKSIKEKIKEHYSKADAAAKEKFESIQKSVEQVLLRNNAFIVHAIQIDERNRHNANSNISQRANIEDDIDILLSLEPSISTSSVIPGTKQGLWENRMGVVLGGGEIMGGAQTDNQTQVGGIKYRNGTELNSNEIDALVSDRGDRSYNELVVNNPKVFAFYQTVTFSESGKMLGFVRSSKSSSDNAEYKADFIKQMDLAARKGMPLTIMTPDRRLFEFFSINDEGEVSVGLEITPGQVALGNAGLSGEKRVSIGSEVIAKNLFKKLNHQEEAKGIIAELAGEESAGSELTEDEYFAYLKDNPEGVAQLPEKLRDDREFMFKAVELSPYYSYLAASQNLKDDLEFVKHVYAQKGENGIYSRMSDELKNNEDVTALAIENGDINFLNLKLADSPIIWDKLTDKLAENASPEGSFARGIGNIRNFDTNLIMYNDGVQENVSERLANDENFIKKLNEKHPGFKYEKDNSGIFVTKLN